MKILFQILVALLLLGGLAACTQNDKVIGDRFGMWKVNEITINGETDTDYHHNMFWSFQANVICMKLASENPYTAVYSSTYGGCTKKGDKLILDYRNTDSSHPEEGDPYYSPLPQSHLPSNCEITLDIIHLSGSSMELKYDAEDGAVIVYKLEKWD